MYILLLVLNLYKIVVFFIKKLYIYILSFFFYKFGKNIIIEFSTIFDNPSRISIGNNVYIGRNSLLQGYNNLSIGDNTMIAHNVSILTRDHLYKNKSILIKDQGHKNLPIEIGEDVWIGTNVVVLPGIKIGSGSIIAANSVVNKNVDEYTVVGGVPIKIISYRE